MQYVCVSLLMDVPVCFGGTDASCAHGTLTSIGGLGPNNAALSAAISAVLQAKLGVPPARFYLAFNDVAGNNMVCALRRCQLPASRLPDRPADAAAPLRRAGTEAHFERRTRLCVCVAVSPIRVRVLQHFTGAQAWATCAPASPRRRLLRAPRRLF